MKLHPWKTTSGGHHVCLRCRRVTKHETVCALCRNPTVSFGPRWRAPRASDVKAWKKIWSGLALWDDAAREKKARKENWRRRGRPEDTVKHQSHH